MDMYEKFLSVTGYNIKDFFQSYVDFCSEYYPYIVDYYQGGEINADSFSIIECRQANPGSETCRTVTDQQTNDLSGTGSY